MTPYLLFLTFSTWMMQAYCTEQQNNFTCGVYQKICFQPHEYCDGDICRNCRSTCGRPPDYVPKRCQKYCSGIIDSKSQPQTTTNTTARYIVPAQSKNTAIVKIEPYVIVTCSVIFIAILCLLLYCFCRAQENSRLELCNKFCVKWAVLFKCRSNNTSLKRTFTRVEHPTDDSVEEGLFTGANSKDGGLTFPMLNYQNQKLIQCN